MDFIEEAKKLGFSDAAVMKTDKLVFVPEYRVFCEENACGNYDKNPACPPESGTVEEMKERALDYENTLVLQTTQDRLLDYRKAKLAHNKLTEQLSKKDLRKIPELSIIGPALHSHSICHLLRIHTIGRHTGIMLVRSGAHDQNICFSALFHLL